MFRGAQKVLLVRKMLHKEVSKDTGTILGLSEMNLYVFFLFETIGCPRLAKHSILLLSLPFIFFSSSPFQTL